MMEDTSDVQLVSSVPPAPPRDPSPVTSFETASAADPAEPPAPPPALLSEVQVQMLQEAFHRETDGDVIGVQQLETLAAKLFQDTLTDEMLDIIIDQTDGKETVTCADFLEIMAGIMSRTTFWGQLKTTMKGAVGFDTLPQQMNAKAMKRGFEFNIMLVGESGLGKSTLADTLFNADVSYASSNPTFKKSPRVPQQTLEIHTVTHVLEENKVRLKLSITDTPGFGDQVNNSNFWNTILTHVEDQFQDYLNTELSIDRPARIPDTRIHCCLYFIAPTGHGLKPLDMVFMRQLHHRVNIIPVIAKADSLTLEERSGFKARIREDLETAGIQVYPTVTDDDEEQEAINSQLRALTPFAVVGASTTREENGARIRGRSLPCGFVNVDDPNHCDFTHLQNFLLRTHLEDLKETTAQVHYETFRRQRLASGEGLM